jgi:hypothetical protein
VTSTVHLIEAVSTSYVLWAFVMLALYGAISAKAGSLIGRLLPY